MNHKHNPESSQKRVWEIAIHARVNELEKDEFGLNQRLIGCERKLQEINKQLEILIQQLK